MSARRRERLKKMSAGSKNSHRAKLKSVLTGKLIAKYGGSGAEATQICKDQVTLILGSRKNRVVTEADLKPVAATPPRVFSLCGGRRTPCLDES